MYCHVEAKDLFKGTLRFELRGELKAKELHVDGKKLGYGVYNNFAMDLPSGPRRVRIVGENGAICEKTIQIEPGKTSNAVCDFSNTASRVEPAPQARIPPGKKIDLDFKQASIHDVLRTMTEVCGLNTVTPDYINPKITINLKQAPCDQALEVLLESQGLWYRYEPKGNLVLIADRKQIDRDAEMQVVRERAGYLDDALPDGPDLDLDFKGVSFHDLMRLFASAADVNVVVPEHINAKVTIKLQKAPWDAALRTVLEAHGLWYRYRPNGKLLRIADRKDLDRETEAELVRSRKR